MKGKKVSEYKPQYLKALYFKVGGGEEKAKGRRRDERQRKEGKTPQHDQQHE